MMSAGEPVLRTEHLTKRYGTVAALTDLDLSVPRGTIYGFLGPNGAGKTTTIKLLLGFIRASSGRASIEGHDCWRDGVAARADLGFLVQPDNLFTDMTGLAHLDYAAKLSGKPPVLRDKLLDALDLSGEALRRRLGSYSKGMRQKLALISAIQHDPALLILDEPTDGLDPLIQRGFEEVLRDLRARGRTVFMSSHDLAEVERTCELVAVVRGGRLVAEETVNGLKRLHRRRARVQFADGVPDEIGGLPGVQMVTQRGSEVSLLLGDDVNPLLAVLARHRVVVTEITPPSLDDIFMAFYGEQAATIS